MTMASDPDNSAVLNALVDTMAIEDTPEPTDEMLLKAVAQGDHPAFRRLVQRHHLRVHRLATRTLGSADRADDVTQEAFLRVWVHAAAWQAREARFYTWLYRVVINLCIDQHRLPKSESLDTALNVADTARAIDEQIGQTRAYEQVVKVMGDLPIMQRTAMVLCHYEGFSNAEAAKIVGISTKAVESLLVRARRTLRAQLVSSAMDDR
jgi:RNA polymerase sigma-70 factor, ECF subfamily